MVKNENYLVIQGWMIAELKLKGNELLIYAIIYGFSQNNQQFKGSHRYLADWCNSTRQGIMKNIESLIKKKLLEKKEVYINNVKFCRYRTLDINVEYLQDINKVDRDGKQSLQRDVNKNDKDSKQSLQNNKEDIIDNNLLDNIDSLLFMEKWNKLAKECKLSLIKSFTENRKKKLSELLEKYTQEEILETMFKIKNINFLLGRTDKSNWKITFDDFLNEEKFIKILEGGYYEGFKSINKQKNRTVTKSTTKRKYGF